MLAQTIVITGGHTGLGLACTQALLTANAQAQVIIGSRDVARAGAALQQLDPAARARCTVLALDLASLASVRAFARAVIEREGPPLRALICNAGIQIVNGTEYTADGIETTFGVNHLGHFLLIHLLLQHLEAPARILLVGSGTHDPRQLGARIFGMPAPRFRDPLALAYPDQYPDPDEEGESAMRIGRRRYTTSKLCTLLCAYEFARRLEAAGLSTPDRPITVNVFDPGMMPGTGLTRQGGAFVQFMWHRVLPVLNDRVKGTRNVATSGRNLAWLALDSSLNTTTARYFIDRAPEPSSPESYDVAEAAQLWDASVELVALRPEESPLLHAQVVG